MDQKILKTGDRVRLRLMGDASWVHGFVDLASSNGEAIMVRLDGALRDSKGGMYFSAIPLLVDYQRERVHNFTGDDYELEFQ